MKRHICIKVETAMKMLRKGKNIFNVDIATAYVEMERQKAKGKEYFTGCDNEDANGRCGGHADSITSNKNTL